MITTALLGALAVFVLVLTTAAVMLGIRCWVAWYSGWDIIVNEHWTIRGRERSR